MKICKECKTRMEDIIAVCPECGCEAFDVEEQTEKANKVTDEAAVDAPTIVMDAVKVEEPEKEEPSQEDNKTESQEEESAENKKEKKPLSEKLAVLKKLKPWQICIIVAVLVAVIVVIVLAATGVFSGTNRHYKNAKVETPADIVAESTAPAIKNTSYVMTEEPMDLQIKLGQSVYKTPMLVSDVLASGWNFGDKALTEEPVAAGAKAETYLVSSKGAIIFVTITNFGKEEANINECCIIGLTVDGECLAGEKATFVKNLTVGSLRKAVEEVFGECDDVVQANKGTTLTYTKSDKKYATFVFDNKTSKLKSVTYFNDTVPEEYQSSGEVKDEPEQKEDYVKPNALGKDITSGAVQIEGDLYKFPILVSEFIDNGWEITFKEDRAILFGNETLIGTLKKGDLEIEGVEVYNFESVDCRIKNCYVVSMEASVDMAHKVVLPGNIKPGMAEADYLEAIKDATYEFDSTHFNEYVFKKGDLSITIDVDKDDKTVKYILVTNYSVSE